MAYGQGRRSVSRRYAHGKIARYSGGFPDPSKGSVLIMISGILLGMLATGNPIVLLCLPVVAVVLVVFYAST
jgi:hypothetical protein